MGFAARIEPLAHAQPHIWYRRGNGKTVGAMGGAGEGEREAGTLEVRVIFLVGFHDCWRKREESQKVNLARFPPSGRTCKAVSDEAAPRSVARI